LSRFCFETSKLIYHPKGIPVEVKSSHSNPLVDFDQFKFFQIFALLFLLGFLAYSNAILYPFVHDDIVFIQQNPNIASLSNFNTVAGQSSALSITNSYWRPLLEIFYRLEYRFLGLNPHGYHFLNILLHVINSSLVFASLNTVFKRTGLALSVAIVFLLHPVQSEAVACISGISNLLFAFWGLLSFLFYCRGKRSVSLLFYALALLTKEQAVVFPFLIFFYEKCLVPPGKAGNRAQAWGGFLAITILYFFVRKLAVGTSMAPFWQHPQELWLRLLSIPRTVLMYCHILIWPNDLHYYRSIDILSPWPAATIKLLVLIAVVALILGFLKSIAKPLLFALGWFVITLLPTLNIIPIIHEYSYIAAFEHFLYLPVVGFFLYIFIVVSRFLPQDQEKSILMVLGLVLVCLGATFEQNKYWRAEVPLFEQAVKYENKLGRVHFLLGRAYHFDGQYDAAIKEFQTALSIMQGYLDKVKDPAAQPFYLGFVRDISFDMAHSFEGKGDWPQALELYQKILPLTPAGAASAEIYNNIGNVYAQTNDFPKAKQYFEKTILLNPNHLMALSNLAVCYIREGNLPKAKDLLNRVLKIDSQFDPAKKNLEQLLLQERNGGPQ
jgi:tetratricopeptide (TPR) repeat protein